MLVFAALDLDIDPASGSNRKAIEVYPHPATVVLFELEKTLKYKHGSFEDRQRDLLELMTLIEDSTRRHRGCGPTAASAWVELRKRVAAARPVQLDRDEDPVDAVLCAYIALVLVSTARRRHNLRRLRDRIHRHAEPSARSRRLRRADVWCHRPATNSTNVFRISRSCSRRRRSK